MDDLLLYSVCVCIITKTNETDQQLFEIWVHVCIQSCVNVVLRPGFDSGFIPMSGVV